MMKIKFRAYIGLWLLGVIFALPIGVYLLWKCWLAEFAPVPTTYALAQPVTNSQAVAGATFRPQFSLNQVDATLFIRTNELGPDLRRLRWKLEFTSWRKCDIRHITIFSADYIIAAASFDGTHEELYLFTKKNNAWDKQKMR